MRLIMKGQVITIVWFTAFSKTHTHVFVEGREETIDYYKLQISVLVGVDIIWVDAWQFRPGMEGKALDVTQPMKIKPIPKKDGQ